MKNNGMISATLTLILLSAVLLAGCGGQESAQETPQPRQEASRRSATRTLVEGFTGRTAVESGKRAQKDIRAVSSNKQEQLDQILGGD